jgi:hypothetical protein
MAVHTWDFASFSHIAKWLQDVPEFMVDLIKALSTSKEAGEKCMNPEDFFAGLDTCQYHEHTLAGKPCYKEKRKFLL